MKSYKTIFASILSIIFLASCTTTAPEDGQENGLKKISGVGFTIKVPASWEEVNIEKISAPIRGKFELAMRSTVNKRGFMNNITILSDTVMTEVSSGEYARQSMVGAARDYLSMNVEKNEMITFDDKTTSQLGIFRAKYNEVTEERLFFQTAKICNKTVYLLTIGLYSDTQESLYDQYRKVLQSFTCTSNQS